MAYLSGFLAGSATAQAAGTGVQDSAGLRRILDTLTHGELRFPYGPNVYVARLDDFYWWEDRREIPIWLVMWEVNHDLRRSAAPDP